MSLIEYKDVELRRKEFVVFKDVTFSIDSGQPVYLVGKVGSGKSTLLKSLYAEVPVSGQGHARVLGYDMGQLRRRDIPMLRRRMGIVFQDFQLLMDRNVYANLDFVLLATGWRDRKQREDRILAVLDQVGMPNKSYKMPHQLSGGEQQRVVIARAMLNNPDIILADEPTGNLDPETGQQIFHLLSNIASEGKAVVVATHNHSLIDQFPGRVFICEDKHLSELP